MKSIYIDVNELRQTVADIRRSGANTVEISISPSEDGFPAFIQFNAFNRDNIGSIFEPEPIEELPDRDNLEKLSLFAPHTNIL